MAKKLKIWNGRGWGRANYGKNYEKLPTPISQWCERIYICATSKAEALRICEAVGHPISMHEINEYWSAGCWGNSMDGIEPEVGLWGTQDYSSKPVRLYPKE